MASPVRMKIPAFAAFAGLLGLGIGLAQASPTLSACLAQCKKSNLSETNRATCRLDCETDAASDPEQIRARMERSTPTPPARSGPSPTRPDPAPMASAGGPAKCKAGCDADRSLSVDDRASCKLDCEQEALPVPGGPLPIAGAPPPSVAPVPRPGVPTQSQAGFLARCHATCSPGPGARGATDFETCKLDCDTMASVLDVASQWVPDAWLTPAPATPVTTPATVPAVRAPTPVASPPITAPVSSPPVASADTCGPALARCNAGCTRQEGTCERACGRKHVQETDRETCKLGCGTDREVCQGDCLSASATCVNGRNRR